MKPRLQPTFTDDQAEDLFRRALAITERLAPADDLRAPLFQGVATMLAQFHAEQPGQALMPASALRGFS